MKVEEFIEILRRPLAELPHELEMVPLPGPFDVTIRPPGSKSITNRVLLLAALAEGESEITGALLDADDARVMIEALRTLGAEIEHNEDEPGAATTGSSRACLASARGSLRIRGTGGRLHGNCTLNLKNAGTATRFLTAAACLADGPVIIDGNERMRQRPIGELVAMLRELGVKVDELGAPGCVPLRVHPGRFTKDEIEVGRTQSSQFISALMLIAPFIDGGMTFVFGDDLTSVSYMQMNVLLLFRNCGVPIREEVKPGGVLRIPQSAFRGIRYEVESDASGMTYFWAAAATTPGATTWNWGLGQNSIQGDTEFAHLLIRSPGAGHMCTSDTHVSGTGTVASFNEEMSLMPDAAMTLAAVACFATSGETTTITGLRTLRVKETDRLAAMQKELSKLGVKVEIFSTPDSLGGATDEGIRITPPPGGGIDCSPAAQRVVFDTYDDHRMAMSLALIGLRRPNVVIRDPRCVAKTYPTYWQHLSKLYESALMGGAHVE